jgi:hypothetical protein
MGRAHMHRRSSGIITSRTVDNVGYGATSVTGQPQPSTSSTATILAIPTIIGVAIAGFIVLFGLLVAVGCYCARARHRKTRRRSHRSVTLMDGNSEIIETLRSGTPHDLGSGGTQRYPQFHSRTSSVSKLSQEWKDEKDTMSVDLKPPTFGFHITGLRDSWPLVSWSKDSMLELSGDDGPRSSYAADFDQMFSARIDPQNTNLTKPLRTLSTRKLVPVVIHDIGPAIRSTHSAKGSISSIKAPSSHRRSISDSQLTSILRSTSQRLRSTERVSNVRSRSRSSSIILQASGPPPEKKPSTPPRERRPIRRKSVAGEKEGFKRAISTKSSLRNVNSFPHSPDRMIPRVAGSGRAKGRMPSPSTSFVSDDDSIYGNGSAETVISAALTSPSRGRRLTKRHNVIIPSENSSPTQVHEDKRISMDCFGSDLNFIQHGSKNSDPFITSQPVSNAKQRSGPRPNGARPQIQRKATFGHDSNPKLSDLDASRPLRAASGNLKAPVKEKHQASTTQSNPFQWAPQTTKTSVSPPRVVKKKGHKRSQTVRVSGLPRITSNVSVVQEEPENEVTPPTYSALKFPPPVLQVCSPGATTISSPMFMASTSNSARPPSVQSFQPFLAPPPTNASIDLSNRSSLASYPMSVFDYYSQMGTDPSTWNLAVTPSPSASPSPPASPLDKKSNRHARNFSLEALAHSPNQPLINSLVATTIPVLHPSSTSNLNVGLQSDNHPPSLDRPYSVLASTPRVSLVQGPRSQLLPTRKASVQHSVGLLRRMNSELSTYSNASHNSNTEVESPTLPELRGGGSPPSKRGYKRGSKNYLKIGGGTKTPSPQKGSRKKPRFDYGRESSLESLNEELDDGMTIGSSLQEGAVTQREREDKKPSPPARRNRNFFAVPSPDQSPSDQSLLSSPSYSPSDNGGTYSLGLRMPVLERNGSPLRPAEDGSPTRTRRVHNFGKSGARYESEWTRKSTPSPEQRDIAGQNQGHRDISKLWHNNQESKKIVTEENKIEGQPKVKKWRNSALYDERGFLKSSPQLASSPLL